VISLGDRSLRDDAHLFPCLAKQPSDRLPTAKVAYSKLANRQLQNAGLKGLENKQLQDTGLEGTRQQQVAPYA